MQQSTDLVGIKKPAGSAWKNLVAYRHHFVHARRTGKLGVGLGGRLSDATIRAQQRTHCVGSAPGSGGLQRAATCHGRRSRLARNFASCGRKAAGHFQVSGLGPYLD